MNEKLNSGLIGNYCPPEISYGHGIEEQMSTYVVGALLYQALHQKLPPRFDATIAPVESVNVEIKPIPRISQILKISLSPVVGERFSLSQLLGLLVETRQSYRIPKVRWDVACRSTLGLSTSRLQNEDSYGIRQQASGNADDWILGVVADGMGGMAQGEVASRLAVKTVLEATLPTDLTSQEQRAGWLVSLVEQANECVSSNVRDGGTTISVVFARGRDLAIAHVGDSRIFLLRKEQICQLSEDHSIVAMLVASGEITYKESKEHPDRNVLTKSLGAKRRLSDGYVQDLSRFGSDLSMPLDSGDTLILCSDGVWDLISAENLAEIFSTSQNLQAAVDTTIDKVIDGLAHDNATVLALKCYVDYCYS